MAINLESTPSYKRYILVVPFYCWWRSPEVLTADSILFAKFDKGEVLEIYQTNTFAKWIRSFVLPISFNTRKAQYLPLERTSPHKLSQYHASDSGGHNLR